MMIKRTVAEKDFVPEDMCAALDRVADEAARHPNNSGLTIRGVVALVGFETPDGNQINCIVHGQFNDDMVTSMARCFANNFGLSDGQDDAGMRH